MLLRWLLAVVHLLALLVGGIAIFSRARALASPLDMGGLRRLFAADSWWGLSAVLWIATGLWRLLASTEMPTAYYMANRLFWLKMGLLGGILLLELAPMVGLMRWRTAVRRGDSVDTSRAPVFARISAIQLVLVVLMVLAATAMARGLGV